MNQNIKVGLYTIIDDDVEIGDNCFIGNHVVIHSGTKIGANCKIHDFAVLGGDPQDLKYSGEKTFLEIGDNTIIREFVTVNRGTKATNTTIIGSNTLIMAYAHIAHDCRINNHVVIANSCQIAGHVIVDDYAILGGTSAVKQFCHIGKYAFLSGGSLLVKDIPPFVIGGRYPVKFLGLNTIGLRRHNFQTDDIEKIKHFYSQIYKDGIIHRNFSPTNSYEQEILDFINNSRTGIIPE